MFVKRKYTQDKDFYAHQKVLRTIAHHYIKMLRILVMKSDFCVMYFFFCEDIDYLMIIKVVTIWKQIQNESNVKFSAPNRDYSFVSCFCFWSPLERSHNFDTCFRLFHTQQRPVGKNTVTKMRKNIQTCLILGERYIERYERECTRKIESKRVKRYPHDE